MAHDDETELILHLLGELITSSVDEANELKPAINAVSKVAPDLLPLAVKYMSTGSMLAKDDAAITVHLLLRGINEDKEAASKWLTHEDVYRERVESFTCTPLNIEMTMRWHFNNVAAEIGMPRADSSGIIRYAVNNWAKQKHYKEQTVEYWRGFAALHLASGGNVFLLQPDAHSQFIEWAGHSSEMPRIITLALERESLDVEQLQTLLNEQDAVARSIREGAL